LFVKKGGKKGQKMALSKPSGGNGNANFKRGKGCPDTRVG